MPDPFSVSASVVGLISFCADSSKLLFRFITSILDAPNEVRGIITSLKGLDIALRQIQNLLLDLTYSSETAPDDLDDLEQSVALLGIVERDLGSSVKTTGLEMPGHTSDKSVLGCHRKFPQVKIYGLARFRLRHGSTLSFAFTEMDEDSASLIVIPDALSGVNCVSTRVDFPVDTINDDSSEATRNAMKTNYASGTTADTLESKRKDSRK
ncbi:hypothetical protein BJX76DRAFT_356767 [Aspergillus varians]